MEAKILFDISRRGLKRWSGNHSTTAGEASFLCRGLQHERDRCTVINRRRRRGDGSEESYDQLGVGQEAAAAVSQPSIAAHLYEEAAQAKSTYRQQPYNPNFTRHQSSYSR